MTKTLLDYVRETQARYLKASRGEVEHFRSYGLCHNCMHSRDIPPLHIRVEVKVLVSGITQKWPAYSGSPAFPVPDPAFVYITNEQAAEAAARAYYRATSGGMYSGEYGSLRKRLAAYIAEGLAEWIKNEEREERGE